MSKDHKPFVSSDSQMTEFSLKAILIGLVMSVVLGAANAYLGLKAGMTISASYPAAVIGMAFLKVLKGSILEENTARTIGSVGETVAAGAIFTIPAFLISGVWSEFYTPGHYILSTFILMAGGVLGIMFVALLRRMMVDDKELPFPESVAAAEIHKAGQSSGSASKYLFGAMIGGALIKILGDLKLFAAQWEKFIPFGKETIAGTPLTGQGGLMLSSPAISPAYFGVGYIIGPKLGALNFSGGVLAWGLLAPIIYYFLAPAVDGNVWASYLMGKDASLTMENALLRVNDPAFQISQIWRFIVKPIAVGGMLSGAVFTLFKMRKSLTSGMRRAVNDLKNAVGAKAAAARVERDLSFFWILIGIGAAATTAFFISYFAFHVSVLIALFSSVILLILAFFFAAVSGYLVGIIGSSNNPISGLTLTALVITALLLLTMGVSGQEGIASVLGTAAIIAVSSAVAGEMLQDLKAGHLLGGTPWKMQAGNLLGVALSGCVMFGVFVVLNDGDIAKGALEGYEGGFGSKSLAAPQAGLMAMLSRGIVDGQMAWPLIIVGMLMGVSFIMMQVKSPMLVSVGMYLPLETTFAIFIGGLVKGIVEWAQEMKNHTEIQKSTSENTGILLASGLIAGEALTGLVFAALYFFQVKIPAFFESPSFLLGALILILTGFALVILPLKNAARKKV